MANLARAIQAYKYNGKMLCGTVEVDDERIHDINSFELINAGRQSQNDDADLDEDEPENTAMLCLTPS